MTSNTQQVRTVWDSTMEGAYNKHLESYNINKLPYRSDDIREIGLKAYAKHEEDKKVRSGLIRYYDGLSTKCVANAILDSSGNGDILELQAAVESLIKRGDIGLLVKVLFEAGELPFYMTPALIETLYRNKLDWLTQIPEAISDRKRAIHFLNHHFTSLSPSDILHMHGDFLRSIIKVYKEFDEESPEETIRGLTKGVVEKIKRETHESPICAFTADFFGLSQVSDPEE